MITRLRHMRPAFGPALGTARDRRLVTARMDNENVKPWQQSKWFRGLAVLGAVGLAVGLWSLTRPSLPDQREVEQEVASGVGEAENTTVTANCTVPDDTGYTCRLRDAAGRYGHSITTFHEEHSQGFRHTTTTRYGRTSWDFPLDADGTGTKTLDASPPRDLSLTISGVLMMISGTLGEPEWFSLHGAIDCGDEVISDVTTCAVRAPVLSATVRPLGDHKYELTYRVALPSTS